MAAIRRQPLADGQVIGASQLPNGPDLEEWGEEALVHQGARHAEDLAQHHFRRLEAGLLARRADQVRGHQGALGGRRQAGELTFQLGPGEGRRQVVLRVQGRPGLVEVQGVAAQADGLVDRVLLGVREWRHVLFLPRCRGRGHRPRGRRSGRPRRGRKTWRKDEQGGGGLVPPRRTPTRSEGATGPGCAARPGGRPRSGRRRPGVAAPCRGASRRCAWTGPADARSPSS